MTIYVVTETITEFKEENAWGYYSSLEKAQQAILKRVAEEYTEEELRPYFDKEFEERILPPVYKGKRYILDHLERLYFVYLNKEEVIKKLQS